MFPMTFFQNFRGNEKRFYRNLQTRQVAVTQLMKENGNFTDTDLKTAMTLGEYFKEFYNNKLTYSDTRMHRF